MNAKVLSAWEACQVLREIALWVRVMRRLVTKNWAETYCGMLTAETDGWIITPCNHCNTLDYCHTCYSPRRLGVSILLVSALWN